MFYMIRVSKSDEMMQLWFWKFKGEDTLFSRMVASLRSGNERWILVCKRPGFIKEGFKPGMIPVVFDDVWLGWGFQANFMYKPAM